MAKRRKRARGLRGLRGTPSEHAQAYREATAEARDLLRWAQGAGSHPATRCAFAMRALRAAVLVGVEAAHAEPRHLRGQIRSHAYLKRAEKLVYANCACARTPASAWPQKAGR